MRQWTQQAIADHLGLTQQTVSNDIRAVQKRWRESSLIDINEARQRELQRIDELEVEYWLAWQESKKDAEVARQKQKDGSGKEVSLEKRGQTGDPRYLQGIQWCVEQRRKILGIDAPDQLHITAKVKGYSSDFNPDNW